MFSNLYEKIVNGEEKISLVGLGYVGMPIAVAFSKKVKVVGFDLNAKKIELYKNGIDPTNEVGDDAIKACLEAVGPTCNFAGYSVLSKLTMIMGMLAGRLETFPILVLFSRSTWKRK